MPKIAESGFEAGKLVFIYHGKKEIYVKRTRPDVFLQWQNGDGPDTVEISVREAGSTDEKSLKVGVMGPRSKSLEDDLLKAIGKHFFQSRMVIERGLYPWLAEIRMFHGESGI